MTMGVKMAPVVASGLLPAWMAWLSNDRLAG
jgi:hypothetical protein